MSGSTNQPYLVVRLIPEAPIDGATFTTYLEGLQLQVFDAFQSDTPLSDIVYSSPLSLFSPLFFAASPGNIGNFYQTAVSSPVTAPPNYQSAGNYGQTLTFNSTDGISAGAYVFSTDQTTIPWGSGLQVTQVTTTTVTLSNPLPNYVPTGTVVSFVAAWPNTDPLGASGSAPSFNVNTTGPAQTTDGSPASATDLPAIIPVASTAGVTVGMTVTSQTAGWIAAGTTVSEVNTATSTVTISPALLQVGSPPSLTFSLNEPFVSLALTANSSTATTLTFNATAAIPIPTAGVAVGMTLTSSVAGQIPPGTMVTAVTDTVVTVAPALPAALPTNQSVTFTFPLSSGIVQHVAEVLQVNFFNLSVVVVPMAVATAIIPLNYSTPDSPGPLPLIPDCLNINITANRTTSTGALQNIPIKQTQFYNVVWQEGAPDPSIYQLIPANETSLYITLPPQPGTTPIALAIPSDGSPPPFDALYQAIASALSFDPIDDLMPVTQAATATSNTNAATANGAVLSFAAPPGVAAGMFVFGSNIAPGTMVSSVAGSNVTLSNQVLGTGVSNGQSVNFAPAVGAVTFSTNAPTANGTSLSFAAPPAVVAGMFVFGSNIAPGTIVSSIAGSNVTLNSQVFGTGVSNGQAITFTSPAGLIAALGASYAYCTRIAYDIVWSYRNTLPIPPDLLESLYTDPPNPGNSSTQTGGNNNNQVLEQDRQKFEGTLNSFYSTRNATAERLAKFVSAVSAAVYCELTSVKATAALLVFPVDSSQPFASAVESEIVLQGISGAGANAINFGVPAAFFYALGAKMDKSTTAAQRYQMATGDAIDRLLQEFSAAENADVIEDSEAFLTSTGTSSITSFQAARRLVALGVSAASGSPTVTLNPAAATGTPEKALVDLVNAWLAATDPTGSGPPPNPPPSYEQKDYSIWQAIETANQTGYAALDLYALTQGYVISAATGPLADQILASATFNWPTTGATVNALEQVTSAQWTTFFTNNPPTWLPPFTQPVTPAASPPPSTLTTGYIGARIRAFIRAVQKFFTVSSVATSALPWTPGAPPAFALPANDPFGKSGLPFNAALTAAQIDTAAQSVFANPGAAQNWLVQALITVNQLTEIAKTVPAPSGYMLPASLTLTANSSTTTTLTFNATATVPIPTAGVAVGMTLSSSVAGQIPPGTTVTAVANTVVTVEPALPATLPANQPVTFAPSGLAFSVAEALFARGFRTAADITKLSPADFQQALTGTIAYDYATGATGLYEAAQAIAAGTPPTGAGGGKGFQPINPNGQLTNCIPPPCLSPLGPVAYLAELLKVSERSRCDDPFPTPRSKHSEEEEAIIRPLARQLQEEAGVGGHDVDFWLQAQSVLESQGRISVLSPPTLGSVLAQRRGPLGNLLASCANVETRLPLVDIANECLESMAAAPANTTGTVYQTAEAKLAGYRLCQKGDCEPDPGCFEPEVILASMPEHSTPAVPNDANKSVEPVVFDNLKADFSACGLPYSQPLDVSRSYLRILGGSRFETLRHFRKCITEFALDPKNPPSGFESFLWRFPLRIDTAIEYLGITPEEYEALFQGTPAQPCYEGPNQAPDSKSVPTPSAASLYGVAAGREGTWTAEVSVLSEFLRRTCLSYCEFLEIWNAMVHVGSTVAGPTAAIDRAKASPIPKCEPCCLKDYRLPIDDGENGERLLIALAVLIRLWRKMREHCGARYSFAELLDINIVFSAIGSGAEYIRQLAAFQMLRDAFGLPLSDPANQVPEAIGADRSQLLTLWLGSSAKDAKGWNWAVARLLEGVNDYAKRQFGRAASVSEGRLAERLNDLSRLAGFDPETADTWNSGPACTLRFAEVLAKILASGVKPGALLYLFNAEPADEAEPWFPLTGADEADANPLDLPADDAHHSLWALRRELLAVEVSDEEVHGWTWPRVIHELREHFGYAPPAGQEPLLSLGQHFFPDVLEAAGFSVTAAQRQYRVGLNSPTPWNTPPGPLHYDRGAVQLSVELPLSDEAVAAQLGRLPALNPAEQAAVNDLYFAPRADLGLLAFLFPDWQAAEQELIQEPDEHRRWWRFRRHLALAVGRRKRIAAHLARHVAAQVGCREGELHDVAALVLSHLLADENTGTPWEEDSGVPPTVMWTPPAGGAVAALLALAGTGLRGDYQIEAAATTPPTNAAPTNPSSVTGAVANPPAHTEPVRGPAWELVWRDVRGPLDGFGHERDAINSPVPTVVPPLALSLAGPPVTEQNGYATLADGRRLGGAAGFRVCWSGTLLVEHDGEYAFHAGAPAPEGETPQAQRAETTQWRVMLQRGESKPTLVLNHQWPGETGQARSVPRLRHGAYRITVDYAQPAPDLTAAHPRPQRTGFEVKYAGPDSGDRLVALPLANLYRDRQDATLDAGVTFLPGSSKAQDFLKGYYTGTLRDIRRTYQRAFKAVLFCAGLGLSAQPEAGQSELGLMLANPTGFAGRGYYRTGTNSFGTQLAEFNFDFLPVTDDFHPPVLPTPNRSAPSLQRTQAMFDWWERLFDYVQVRHAAARRGKHHIWLLFREAKEGNPTNPALPPLLTLIGATAALAPMELRYYQDQNSPIYEILNGDLTDDRWLVRVWHAQTWLDAAQKHFHVRQLAQARPDLWVAGGAAKPLSAAGLGQKTGNADLTELVNAVCLAEGEPRRLRDLRQVNDGLRLRGRAALLAYLCAQNRVALPFQPGSYATKPEDIADLLLLDVQAGPCATASRIEEAITAVQSFIRRARLTLEPNWKVSHDFVRLWDSRFVSFHVWQRAKQRELYSENWIEWREIGAARRIEAFRFLENQLRGATLSLAAPGGTDWWVDEDTPLDSVPQLLQRRDPSDLWPLTPPPGSVTREGLGTLGSPQQIGAPSWLAAVPAAGAAATQLPPPMSSAAASVARPALAASAAPSAQPATGSAAAAPATQLASAAPNVAQAATLVATAGAAALSLPLWMQAAADLGTAFLRIAAAGLPPAALPFVPRSDGGQGGCCDECHEYDPKLIDEYYFWLIAAETYVYTDETDQNLGDANFIGSYQFGFQDAFYDQVQQQSAEWDEEDQVPQLLAKWQPMPAVRLAWCRVHNGQFGQPRKSDLVLQVADAPSASDLVFLGRVADSLYFAVSNPATAPTGYTDKSPAGFRYDIVSDCAEVLPAPAVPITYPAGLPAYPFYAYHDSGAPLFPRDWFAPALVVADALRVHCDFELAAKWYGRAFDPLRNDCTWMDCSATETSSAGGVTGVAVGVQGSSTSTPGATGSTQTGASNSTRVVVEAQAGTSTPVRPAAAAPAARQLTAVPPTQAGAGTAGGACCDSAGVAEPVARKRALTLRFCETLLEWGEAVMRRRNAPEAYEQARLLFATAARITGPRPPNVMMQPPTAPQQVASFTPAHAPLNPRLLDLYARVEDRLTMLVDCLDSKRLRDSERALAYFGDSTLREGWRSSMTCADELGWCHHPSPYRFTFLIQKAGELAGRVRELGTALLAAYEKGDAEYLASLRARQERELLALGLSIRQDQWRDADWQVQALQQGKDVSQTNLIYYTGLYQNGLLNDEIQNINLATNAMQMRTSANITEAFGEAMKVIPDIFVGFCSTDSQVPIGTKLAGVFETIAKVMMTVADVQAETAAIDLTEAGWQRRSDDWFHQMQILPIEIQQVEVQILGAQRRRDQAMQELNNQQRQIENATEVLDFLRDKFTTTEQYLWVQKETAAMYRQMYELAHRTALQAQHAFNLERGHTTRQFLPDWAWDDLHAGLLAGERLQSALHHMEMAYLNENVREYELTKHISLRLQFPMAFLRLRATGRCEIDIPEWMFDLDYPGHYMRRIRNVTLTIPCVTGPYTGVHCRLTLLSNITRIDPRLTAPVHDCCCPPKPCGCGDEEAARYRLCPDDPRMVKIFGARDAVATSSGQNDSGLFELSFSDPRYLPFEFMGAVSRWRIELPPENNYFDPSTLTDTVLHLNYTAREGGDLLRRAASAAATGRLPGDGWAFFDVRHDFPDAWELFHRPVANEHGRRDMALHLRRKFFPYLPYNPSLQITRVMLMFETADLPRRPPEPPCCCPEADAFGAHVLSFRTVTAKADASRADESGRSLVCRSAAEWPQLYSGTIDVDSHPFHRGADSYEVLFGFPAASGEIVKVYVFCRYAIVPTCKQEQMSVTESTRGRKF
jgi:hypothetical protein